MAQFDLSVIKAFTMPGDAVNTYAMIDAGIVASAKSGLTIPQQAVVDSYRWTPVAADFVNGCPTWAGNDPVPVYFRGAAALVQGALAKWYK